MSLKKKSRKEPGRVEKPWFKFWPKDVPRHIEYPVVPLFEILTKTAEKNLGQTAITYFDREMTYGELNESIDSAKAAAMPVRLFLSQSF
jgi:non-ribosomal peptide synthetase component E (peptide arylation enzyme)